MPALALLGGRNKKKKGDFRVLSDGWCGDRKERSKESPGLSTITAVAERGLSFYLLTLAGVVCSIPVPELDFVMSMRTAEYCGSSRMLLNRGRKCLG